VGNAVVRNRVKRWLREAIRHERSGLELSSLDFVFIAKPGAGDAGAQMMRAEVAEALRKLGRRA
jgi:ribonuclease P protein component